MVSKNKIDVSGIEDKLYRRGLSTREINEQIQKVKEKWKDKYQTSLRNWDMILNELFIMFDGTI